MSEAASAQDKRREPTRWEKLAHTPLRDAIRGQWKTREQCPRRAARARLADVIDAAPIPVTLASIVTLVVRSTRLWKREKIEVARELIVHFVDGIEAGRSSEELAESFGDPVRAAKLIRRAKKRNRPLWWRSWRWARRSAGALALLLIGVYVWGAIRLYSGSPVIAVDYLAELNAPAVAADEADRAWPLYRQALLAIGDQGKMIDQLVGAEFESMLLANQDAISLIREGAARPVLGYVAGYGIAEADQALWPHLAEGDEGSSDSPGLIAVLLPHLGEVRKLSRVLAQDAMRAAAAGDGATAAADVRAGLGVAHQASQSPILIASLVSQSMLAQTFSTLGDVLHRWPDALDDEQLRDLAHAISGSFGGELRVRLEGERMWFHDLVQRIYTDDGCGDGHLSAGGLGTLGGTMDMIGDAEIVAPLTPVAALIVADRREQVEMYERHMDMMKALYDQPLWQYDDARFDQSIADLNASPIARTRFFLTALLLPALSRAHVNSELTEQRRDATLVAIALELYRREHGDWPSSLDALVPALLPAVPRDRFDGEALKYRLVDGAPVLYSVGTDRDDDGGRPPHAADGTLRNDAAIRWMPRDRVEQLKSQQDPEAARFEGDWVLWPVVE